jgi:hypothetical protein
MRIFGVTNKPLNPTFWVKLCLEETKGICQLHHVITCSHFGMKVSMVEILP